MRFFGFLLMLLLLFFLFCFYSKSKYVSVPKVITNPIPWELLFAVLGRLWTEAGFPEVKMIVTHKYAQVWLRCGPQIRHLKQICFQTVASSVPLHPAPRHSHSYPRKTLDGVQMLPLHPQTPKCPAFIWLLWSGFLGRAARKPHADYLTAPDRPKSFLSG